VAGKVAGHSTLFITPLSRSVTSILHGDSGLEAIETRRPGEQPISVHAPVADGPHPVSTIEPISATAAARITMTILASSGFGHAGVLIQDGRFRSSPNGVGAIAAGDEDTVAREDGAAEVHRETVPLPSTG